MSGEMQKKVSNFFITFFIGLIVISFMFTGYESMRGTPDTIAKVGDTPIKAREYQNEFTRQLNFYKQILGGKDLTTQQIKQFRVKDNTIRNLVQRKLMLNLADDLGITPSPDEVRETIKKMPYWQTNEQFDLDKYKKLLTYNRWSPQEFENDTIRQLKGSTVQTLFEAFPISKNYLRDVVNFKKMRLSADIAQINRETLRSSIQVSKKEVQTYLSKPDNKARVENLFKERQTSLDKPEQVQANHILIKVKPGKEEEAQKKIEKIAKKATLSNFKKLANKYTEDPSGKTKGGALGWFSRGQMTPEFEKIAFKLKKGTISAPVKSPFGYHLIYLINKRKAQPATFKKFRKNLTEEMIRKEKNKELDKLVQNLTQKISQALNSKNFKHIEKLKKQYRFQFERNTTINKLEGSTLLDSSSLKTIFTSKAQKNPIHTFNSATRTTVVRITPYRTKKSEKKSTVETERNGLTKILSNKLRQNALQVYQDTTKVKVFTSRIR